MKKIITLLAATTVLITSCSGPLSITRRHYNTGFYVETSAPVQHTEKLQPAEKTPEVKKPVTANLQKENLPLMQADKQTTASTEKKTAPASSHKAVTATRAVPKEVKHVTTAPAKQKSDSNILVHTKTEKSRGTDNVILLLILCILLPPLAVALKIDGLGWQFWVDLLLTLLFFVPGIIFALIVCFA